MAPDRQFLQFACQDGGLMSNCPVIFRVRQLIMSFIQCILLEPNSENRI